MLNFYCGKLEFARRKNSVRADFTLKSSIIGIVTRSPTTVARITHCTTGVNYRNIVGHTVVSIMQEYI